MFSRNARSRRQFRLESLEVRNAPSHVGGLAHLASAVHGLHAAAHVKHYSDTASRDRKQSVDRSTGIEKSRDSVTDSSGTDPNGIDTNSLDKSVQDNSGQS